MRNAVVVVALLAVLVTAGASVLSLREDQEQTRAVERVECLTRAALVSASPASAGRSLWDDENETVQAIASGVDVLSRSSERRARRAGGC